MPTSLGRIDYRAIERGSGAVLADLGVAIDPKAIAGELSLADQQLVEIAKALAANRRCSSWTRRPRPSTAGRCSSSSRRCAACADAAGVVFVSHRLEEVFAITDRITVLKNGEYVATVPAAGTTTPIW